MADNTDLRYIDSIKQLENLSIVLKNENIEIEELLAREVNLDFKDTPSNLDAYDVLFAVLFGITGSLISTSKQINQFCEQIHRHASGLDKSKSNPLQSIIGNLLQHTNDHIDIPGNASNFINRNGGNADGIFHRLFWGHDPFSIGKGDNPFALLINQYGIVKGIHQVFRHLTADTFSSQGLPLPFSSYLDFVNGEGKTKNYLSEIARKAASGKGNATAQGYYSHLFTIRVTDIAAQGLVFAAGQAYFKLRGIKNKIRQTQYKIISYTVNFLSHALIGAIRQGGVPYINWAALSMAVKEVAALFIHSNKETKRLEKVTNQFIIDNQLLFDRGDILESDVMSTGKQIISRVNGYEYVKDYLLEEQASNDLIDLFEEV